MKEALIILLGGCLLVEIMSRHEVLHPSLQAAPSPLRNEHQAMTQGFEYGGIVSMLYVVNPHTGPVPLREICTQLKEQDAMLKLAVLAGEIQDPQYIEVLGRSPLKQIREKCNSK